ncbi:metallophosphoesterase [Rubellimicrobium roseum]|uniref:Metallophosphoesterase n=1 Tax=Rubellimicrobium roseum TaxID=687525 RepID=A0A5C4NHZ5_9RHOB|nr:metallophosphoesterase [Rubellimicrobium roseum]
MLHLSDLHFGRTRPDLLDPLVALVAELSPDLVAISGDFTQRARRGQFLEAAAFLDRLRAPWLAVPGNHDISLHNVLLRFLDPWGRYRSLIHHDLSPRHEDEEITVIGLNTVNRYAHQAGRIGKTALRQIAASRQEQPEKTLVAVMHHPLEHPPGNSKPPMRRTLDGVEALGRAGADIVLSGHLHNAHVAPLTSAPGILLVQAGTGLSTRLRDEPNTLNLLSIEPGWVQVDRYAALTEPVWEIDQTTHFARDPERSDAPWEPVLDRPVSFGQST